MYERSRRLFILQRIDNDIFTWTTPSVIFAFDIQAVYSERQSLGRDSCSIIWLQYSLLQKQYCFSFSGLWTIHKHCKVFLYQMGRLCENLRLVLCRETISCWTWRNAFYCFQTPPRHQLSSLLFGNEIIVAERSMLSPMTFKCISCDVVKYASYVLYLSKSFRVFSRSVILWLHQSSTDIVGDGKQRHIAFKEVTGKSNYLDIHLLTSIPLTDTQRNLRRPYWN